MRIVGGVLGGRTFSGPPTDATRPTSDRAREAIASVIAARRGFEGALVLDLFAGTGAFSFEALSRGARRSIAIDHDVRCVRAIERSARDLDLASRVAVRRLDLSASGAARRIATDAASPIDLVFADPPWRDVAMLDALLGALAPDLAPDALVVVVHAVRDPAPSPAGLEAVGRYRYGDTAVVVYAPTPPDAPGPGVEP